MRLSQSASAETSQWNGAGDAPDCGTRTSCSARGRRQPFKSLFCQHFECSGQEYESQVFWTSLYRHAVPIAWVLHRVVPDFFREDTGFVRDLGGVTSGSEMLMELNRFYGRNVRDRNWIRKIFRLRISGKRVQRLARVLFRAR